MVIDLPNFKDNLMKKLSILALSATVATAPAFAEVHDTPAVTNEVVTYSETADLAFAFEDTENLQLTAMSEQEMQETEGAALPLIAGIAIGGAIGAWSNHGSSYLRTGRLASTRSTLFATGGGMISGGYSTAMLRGAGISSSFFSRNAWNSQNRVTNAVIRTNGYAIGQSTIGVHKNRYR